MAVLSNASLQGLNSHTQFVKAVCYNIRVSNAFKQKQSKRDIDTSQASGLYTKLI